MQSLLRDVVHVIPHLCLFRRFPSGVEMVAGVNTEHKPFGRPTIGILTWSLFYIYMIISILRIRAYVRFAEIGAKSAVSGKPNGWMFFKVHDNQNFSYMSGC